MNEQNSSQALEIVIEPPRTRAEARMRHEAERHSAAKQVFTEWAVKFVRNHGVFLIAVLFLALWTAATWSIAARNARTKTEERLAAEYEQQLHAYIAQQEEARLMAERSAAENQPTIEMQREADALARVIGPMNTKRMKLSMLWNVLMRVDSPYYPNSVSEVVALPSQWIFYSESNPIRADDWDLAMEQLALWHEGRYPAGLKSTFLYGEWSENDYVLRDTWDKTDKTNYWRYPEL
jgi:hypothetical protein